MWCWQKDGGGGDSGDGSDDDSSNDSHSCDSTGDGDSDDENSDGLMTVVMVIIMTVVIRTMTVMVIIMIVVVVLIMAAVSGENHSGDGGDLLVSRVGVVEVGGAKASDGTSPAHIVRADWNVTFATDLTPARPPNQPASHYGVSSKISPCRNTATTTEKLLINVVSSVLG